MQAQRIDNMFNFTFQKTADEIIEKAKVKITAIKAKVGEREGRIRDLRDRNKITDSVLNDILIQMREAQKRGIEQSFYNSSTKAHANAPDEEITIGAGVINDLLTEQDFIEAEKGHVDRLDTIVRNLRDIRKTTTNGTPYIENHTLNFAELKFLGF